VSNTFRVEVDLPFVIHLGEEPIAVDVDGDLFQISLTKVEQPHQDPRLGFTLEDSELERDRHGWVRYSRASIEYDRALAIEDDEVAVLRALSALNIVIEHYRDATDSVWVRPLAIEDLPSPKIIWPAVSDHPTIIVNKVRIGDWRPKILSINPELEDRVRQRVRRGERVPTHRQLLSDAKDALLQGNTRIALIVARSAVENAVDEALLAEFRRRRMRLADVKRVVAGRNQSAWLSPEDAVRWVATDSKLGSIRKAMALPSLDDDATLSLEWDVATSLRNSAVHAAAQPSVHDAQDAVAAFIRIITEYLEPLLTDQGDQIDHVDESMRAIEDAIGTSDPRLSAVVEQVLPRIGKRLVFHHKNSHPRRHERFFDVSAESMDNELHIWIDPTALANDVALEVAGVLVAYELKKEGYPRARPGPHFPVELFSRQVWELVAKHLEMSILHLAEITRLATAGFDTNTRARRSYEALEESIRSADYEAIGLNDLRAKTLPLQLMSKALMLEADDRHALLELVASKDTLLASETRKLIGAVEQNGYDTQERAVQSMVACHNLLWMLDTCIVIDDKARKIYGSQVRDMAIGARNSRLK
jgi:hypothetical protein